jgi:hypothetical protein
VLGIDGAYVPTRPDSAREHRPGLRGKRAKRALWRGQWRDAKGFRFYLLDGDRIVHLFSWHKVQNERELGEALRQVSEAGLIPEGIVRLCVNDRQLKQAACCWRCQRLQQEPTDNPQR